MKWNEICRAVQGISIDVLVHQIRKVSTSATNIDNGLARVLVFSSQKLARIRKTARLLMATGPTCHWMMVHGVAPQYSYSYSSRFDSASADSNIRRLLRLL